LNEKFNKYHIYLLFWYRQHNHVANRENTAKVNHCNSQLIGKIAKTKPTIMAETANDKK
jgi:hypothetical protein